jgi:hypothetical protein
MKATRLLFCLMFVLFVVTNILSAQAVTSANGDTIYITGGTLSGFENAGLLESTINGDTITSGVDVGKRINPNRVYALNEGQAYVQQNAIDVINPTGTLTIAGIPSTYGTTKPVWIMSSAIPGTPISIGNNGCNIVYGSLKFEDLYYSSQQMDGTLKQETFYCGTQNQLPQSLTINNCLFEFSGIEIFDCTDEANAIGGWPYGAKFKITNSYFRNLFVADQWWWSRIFQCKEPIDTLWVENVTTTGGGLTFLQQSELTDFAYLNHNTIVNNHKYWLIGGFYKTLVVTNNIFLNQNWVGEDSTVTNSGQDPDKEFLSTIMVDTINWNHKVVVQPKYQVGNDSTYSPDLDLNKLHVYVSNNINYTNPLLLNYFTNAGDMTGDGTTGYVNSWLDWGYGYILPQRLNNMPCEWMNARTAGLFAAYSPANGGGFVEEHTTTTFPFTSQVDQIDAGAVATMMAWNQNKYSDPGFPTAPDAYHSKMVYGDFDPQTIPGGGTENGGGITHFSDLAENFSQSSVTSTIDGLPVGSLSWDNTKIAAFNSATDYAAVNAAYMAANPGVSLAVNPSVNVPNTFKLSQNYPNPFNPTTTINFNLAKASDVKLTVYNMLGQKVMTLVDSHMNAGQQHFVFDASKLTSGVYFYRLDAGSFSSVKKMMLLK